jgi:Fe-S cluster biogenesis protein NfuA
MTPAMTPPAGGVSAELKFFILIFKFYTMEKKIKEALEKIRPTLQADGGDVLYMGYDEKSGIVQVRLTGMCAGCPMAQMTLKQGIETEIIKAVPEVKSVVAV